MSNFGMYISKYTLEKRFYLKAGLQLADAQAAVDRATPEQFMTLIMANLQNDLLYGCTGLNPNGEMTSNGMYRWAILARMEREGMGALPGWRLEVRQRQSEMNAEHAAIEEVPT